MDTTVTNENMKLFLNKIIDEIDLIAAANSLTNSDVCSLVISIFMSVCINCGIPVPKVEHILEMMKLTYQDTFNQLMEDTSD
jgi:hypothetical protein